MTPSFEQTARKPNNQLMAFRWGILVCIFVLGNLASLAGVSGFRISHRVRVDELDRILQEVNGLKNQAPGLIAELNRQVDRLQQIPESSIKDAKKAAKEILRDLEQILEKSNLNTKDLVRQVRFETVLVWSFVDATVNRILGAILFGVVGLIVVFGPRYPQWAPFFFFVASVVLTSAIYFLVIDPRLQLLESDSTYSESELELQKTISTLKFDIAALNETIQTIQNTPQQPRECRVCFRELEGSSQCQGNRNSCSGWDITEPGKWTELFRDDTDNRDGGCHYQWVVECREVPKQSTLPSS